MVSEKNIFCTFEVDRYTGYNTFKNQPIIQNKEKILCWDG